MARMIAAALSVLLLVNSGVSGAQPPEPSGGSIVGLWTLDKEASDARPQPGEPGERSGRSGRGGGRFGGGRGGFGGGGGRGGGSGRGRGDGAGDEMRRRMQARRDIMDAPERLTITKTDSLVIVTAGDGRTTRLSPDGKKIKDESTGIERKTRWNGEQLVTDITGAGPGKLTQTYAVDPESHRLTVTLQSDNARMPNGGVIHHVYVSASSDQD